MSQAGKSRHNWARMMQQKAVTVLYQKINFWQFFKVDRHKCAVSELIANKFLHIFDKLFLLALVFFS